MNISFFHKLVGSLLITPLLFAMPVFAEEFANDLSLSVNDVRIESSILIGSKTRIYVTIHNNSDSDLSGVVKFYDERVSSFVSADQPVSVLAGKTDDVYIDWEANLVGEHPIAIRVLPWNEDGDDPSNNKVVKIIYVDIDSDKDGIGDAFDQDDDNDGTPDSRDAFPLDPNETTDTDGDGIGNNADTDDDNDGVPDIEDAFPIDAGELKDTDGDGVGDNKDVFPFDPEEAFDSDEDGLGDNADPNDENHGPVPFIFISDGKLRSGRLVTLNALSSVDPDGDITTYEWNFGDGMTDTGVLVTHVFEKRGDYIVTLKVIDDKGEYREQQLEVSVGFRLLTLILVVSTILLILLLLGLFIPGSRFHHKEFQS